MNRKLVAYLFVYGITGSLAVLKLAHLIRVSWLVVLSPWILIAILSLIAGVIVGATGGKS